MEWKLIEEKLQEFAPEGLACGWDNSGLLLGRKEKEIRKVCIALDGSAEAVKTAAETGCDLLLTHHPLVFSPVKRICDDTVLGEKLLTLAERGISLYAMHTNFDSARGGMAELAAEKLGLRSCEPLEEAEGYPSCGIGRVGDLSREMTLEALVQRCKEAFGAETVGLYGGELSLETPVKRIALCPGSGGDEAGLAREKGAEVYITGDLKYHMGMDSAEAGLPLICVDHYAMEQQFTAAMADWFAKELPEVETVPVFGTNPCRFY